MPYVYCSALDVLPAHSIMLRRMIECAFVMIHFQVISVVVVRPIHSVDGWPALDADSASPDGILYVYAPFTHSGQEPRKGAFIQLRDTSISCISIQTRSAFSSDRVNGFGIIALVLDRGSPGIRFFNKRAGALPRIRF